MEQGKSIFQHISHSNKHKQKQEIVMKTLILMNLTPPSIIDNTLIIRLEWNLCSAIY